VSTDWFSLLSELRRQSEITATLLLLIGIGLLYSGISAA
jgi:hypothetical protein